MSGRWIGPPRASTIYLPPCVAWDGLVVVTGRLLPCVVDAALRSAAKSKTPQNTLVVLALGESNSKAIDPRPKPHLLSDKTATVLCGVSTSDQSPVATPTGILYRNCGDLCQEGGRLSGLSDTSLLKKTPDESGEISITRRTNNQRQLLTATPV